MTDNSVNSLVEATKQRFLQLSLEEDELEALLKERQKEFQDLMNEHADLYGQITELQVQLPSGLNTAHDIVDENEKLIDKLKQKVYSNPPEMELQQLSLLEIALKDYGVDEFTMKPYEEVELEIKKIEEAISILKQNMLEITNNIKENEESVENYCKSIQLDTEALQKAEMLMEKELEVLSLQLKGNPPSKTTAKPTMLSEIVQQIWKL